MKKLLQIFESDKKSNINEGVNVSINVSGDSPCDVGEVLAKVTNLSSPRPVTPDMMPPVSSPPPMPMMKAIDIVGKGDGPAVPPAPPGDMAPHTAPEAIGQSVMMPDPSEAPTGGPSTSSQVAPPDMEEGPNLNQFAGPDHIDWGDDDEESDPDEFDRMRDEPGDVEDECAIMPTSDNPGVIQPPVAKDDNKSLTANSSFKEIHDRLKAIDQALSSKNKEYGSEKDESYQNEPDPKYSDIEYMTKDLAGGLNKPKTMYPKSYKQGDSPMAMENTIMSEWEKFKLGE